MAFFSGNWKDLLSSLLTTAVFIWCVLPAYHWHLFPVLCLELSFGKKKNGVEVEAQQGKSWTFSALAGKLGVLAGETGAMWLVASPVLH